VKPKVNSFFLAYYGIPTSFATAEGFKVAYIPLSRLPFLEEADYDFSRFDLVVSADPIPGVRTISPYGGYLIKRVGKARVCIWARSNPPVFTDSIRFLYLKQKPMLKMRSDFILTIGDSEAMIIRESAPKIYRFDFSGRVFIASQGQEIPGLREDSLFLRYEAITTAPLFTVENSTDLVDSLKARIGCDSIAFPEDLILPDLSGSIHLSDLGVLLDLAVQIDSSRSIARVGLSGKPIVDYLLR